MWYSCEMWVLTLRGIYANKFLFFYSTFFSYCLGLESSLFNILILLWIFKILMKIYCWKLDFLVTFFFLLCADAARIADFLPSLKLLIAVIPVIRARIIFSLFKSWDGVMALIWKIKTIGGCLAFTEMCFFCQSLRFGLSHVFVRVCISVDILSSIFLPVFV